MDENSIDITNNISNFSLVDIQEILFKAWFLGIELTLEQERFVQAEISWLNQSILKLAEQARAEDRDTSDDELQMIDDRFYARLEQGLSSKQIQQLRDNRVKVQ